MYNAPFHARHSNLAAHLSPELRETHGARSLPIRRGDTVIIMRGDYAGIEGKVTKVDPKNYRIRVEGVTREKADGTTIFVPIHPSKVLIKRLNLDDKWRKELLKRRSAKKPALEKVEVKPGKGGEMKREETKRVSLDKGLMKKAEER